MGTSYSNIVYKCTMNVCYHCKSKQRMNNYKKSCMKSNIFYKAVCVVCEKKEEIRKEEEGKENSKEKEDEKKECIYLGESSKSLQIRSKQHINRMKSLQMDTFILRHWIKAHRQDNPLEDMKDLINFDVVEFHEKSLERLINEASEIRRYYRNENKTLLNSKLEYNRSLVPDLRDKGISKSEEEFEMK